MKKSGGQKAMSVTQQLVFQCAGIYEIQITEKETERERKKTKGCCSTLITVFIRPHASADAQSMEPVH